MIGAILTGLYCYVTPVQVPDVDLNVLVDLYTGVYDGCDNIDIFQGDGEKDAGCVTHRQQNNVLPWGKGGKTLARDNVNENGGFRGVEVIGGGLGYAGVSKSTPNRASTDYARGCVIQRTTVGDSRRVKRNRVSKRGRKTKRADTSIMLASTRYAPGVVDQPAARMEGVSGSYLGSSYVYWETNDSAGRSGRSGNRVDSCAQKSLDDVFSMCMTHVREQLFNGNQAAVKELRNKC
jgi:hypothetical protein